MVDPNDDFWAQWAAQRQQNPATDLSQSLGWLQPQDQGQAAAPPPMLRANPYARLLPPSAPYGSAPGVNRTASPSPQGGGFDWRGFLPDPIKGLTAPLPWQTQKELGNQSQIGYTVEPLSRIHSPLDALTAIPESIGRGLGALTEQTVGRGVNFLPGINPTPAMNFIGQRLSDVNRLIPGYGGKFQQEHPGLENLLQTVETAGITKGLGRGLAGARGAVAPARTVFAQGLTPHPDELAKLNRLLNSPIPKVKRDAQTAAQYINQNRAIRPEDRAWLDVVRYTGNEANAVDPNAGLPPRPGIPKHTTGLEHQRIGFDINAPHTPDYLNRFAQERAVTAGEAGDAAKGTPLTFHAIKGRYQVAVNGEIQQPSTTGMPRFNAEHLADHLRAAGAGKVRVLGVDQAGRDQLSYENNQRLRGQRGQLGGEKPLNPSEHPEEFLTPGALRAHMMTGHEEDLGHLLNEGMSGVWGNVPHDELLTLHDQMHAGDFRPGEAPIGFDETPPASYGSKQLGKIVPPGMVYGPGGLERAVARPAENAMPPPEDLGNYVRAHPADREAVKLLLDQAEFHSRPLTLNEMQALRQAEQLQGQLPIPNEDLAAFNRALAFEGGTRSGGIGSELLERGLLPEVTKGQAGSAYDSTLRFYHSGDVPLQQPNVSHVGEPPPALQEVPPAGGGEPPSPPPPTRPGLPAPEPPGRAANIYDHPIVRSTMSALQQTMSGWEGWHGFGDLVVASLRGLSSMWRREAAKLVMPAIVKELPQLDSRMRVSDALEGKLDLNALTPGERTIHDVSRIVLNRIADQAMDVYQMLKGMREFYLPQIVKSWTDPVTRIKYGPKDEPFKTALNSFQPKVTSSDRFFLRRLHNDLAAEGFEMERDIARILPTYMTTYGRAVTNQQIVSRALAGVMISDGKKAALSPDDVAGLGGPTRVGTLPGEYADYRPVANIPGISWIHPEMERSLLPLFDARKIGEAAKWASRLDTLYRATAMFLPTIHGLNQIAHQLMIPGRGRIPGVAAYLGHDILKDAARRTEAERYLTQASPHDELMQIQGKMGINPDPNFFQKVHGAMESGLWDHVVTAGQMFAYEQFRDKFIKQGLPVEEARIAAGKMADLAVGTKQLLGNEKAMTYFLFAYRWTENHIAVPILATGDVAGIGTRYALHRFSDVTPAIAKTIAMETQGGFAKALLVTGLYSELMNYVLGGQSSLDNSEGHRFDISIKNITGQDDYIENPLGRFLNWYLGIAKGYGQAGPLGGTVQAIANRLMPPFSTVMQAKELAGDSPPQTIETVLRSFLPDPLRPFGPTGTALTQGQPAGVVGADLATGLLGQSKGVMHGVDQGPITPGALNERAVDVELASQGIAPANASLAQRDAAQHAVDSVTRTDLWSNLPLARELQPYLPNDLAGMSITKQQLARFRDLQGQALAEMGIPQEVQDRLRNQQQSPMALLNQLQKRQLFEQHPELELYSQITPITHDEAAARQDQQTITYRVTLGQAIDQAQKQLEQLGQRFAAGQIDQFAWRDARRTLLDKLWGAGGVEETLRRQNPDAILTPEQRAVFQAKYHLEPTEARPEDLAYQQYQRISLDDPRYTDSNGDQDALQWNADRRAFLDQLPPDVQTYVHMRQEANRTPMEGAYGDAIAKYVNWLSQRPQQAQAYHQLYSTTSNPLQRKVIENRTPGLQAFIKQRLLFLQSDPKLAFWLLHGTAQGRTLRRAGVAPTASPAEAFGQVFPGVSPTAGPAPLNLPPLGQEQLDQELRQYIGVP